MSSVIDDTKRAQTPVEETQEFRLLEQVEEISRDMKKLAAFFNLNELILDQNQLNDSDMCALPYLSELKTLSLNKNEIEDLDRLLETLKRNCPSLTYFSLLGNPACPDQLTSLEETEDDYRCYRLYVLYKLPKLNALDSSMFRKTDREEALRQGPFLKTVKPPIRSTIDIFQRQDDIFRPLPKTSSKSSPRVSFGKSHHTYSGKYSEGNRFIRNVDL